MEELRLRVQLTKSGMMRYLSHSEYTRTIMFAARRSGLPLVYSGKHRKRMKLSLSPPLPIGITSECELVDFSLSEYISAPEAQTDLGASFTEGIEVMRCRLLGASDRPVGKLIDTAAYLAYLAADCPGKGDWNKAVEIFLSRDSLDFERVQPRRTRVVDLRPGVHKLEISAEAGGTPELTMVLDDGTRGTIKPWEVIEALAGFAGANEEYWKETRIHRFGLYARRGDRLVSPMDLGRGRSARGY